MTARWPDSPHAVPFAGDARTALPRWGPDSVWTFYGAEKAVMLHHLACPVCRAALKFVPPPLSLACPFCRTDLKLTNSNIPVGKMYRCGKCRGVFTADAPPLGILVSAAAHVDCPRCQAILKMPANFGPGKLLKCPRCVLTFQPGTKALPRPQPAPAAPPRDEFFPEAPPAPAAPLPVPPPAPALNGEIELFTEAAPEPAAPPPAPPVPAPPPPQPAPAAPVHDEFFPAPPPAPAARPPVADDEIELFAAAPLDPAPSPPPAPAAEIEISSEVPRPPAAAAPAPHRPSEPARGERRVNKPASKTHLVLSKPASKTHLELVPPELPPAEQSDPAEATRTVPLAESAPEGDEPAPAHSPDSLAESLEAAPPPRSAPPRRSPAREATAPPAPAVADPPALPDTQKVYLPPHLPAQPTASPKRGAARKAPPPRAVAPAAHAPVPAPVAVAGPQTAPKPAAPRPLPTPAHPDPWLAPRSVPAPTRPAPQPVPPRPLPARKRAADDEEGTNWKKLVLIAVVLTVVLYSGYSLFTGSWGSRHRTTYATEGVVMYLGKPAVGARNTHFPEAKSKDRYYPTGKVGPDGSFKLTTYTQDDGAPEGRYKVTIVRGVIEGDEWAEMNQKMSQEEVQRIIKERARDPLLEKYSNPEDSGLTVEITPEAPNRLKTFDLQ